MESLPTQLPYRRFVKALKVLGYELQAGRSGVCRHFYNRTKNHLFTCHEPHGNQTIPPGTLRAYIRQLQVSREEFLIALEQS